MHNGKQWLLVISTMRKQPDSPECQYTKTEDIASVSAQELFFLFICRCPEVLLQPLTAPENIQICLFRLS